MPQRLFADERRAAILSMLEQSASVQVGEVACSLGVSRVTARADLDALERDGKLRRTHGGAVSLSRQVTVSVQDRRVNVNVEAKRLIARAAAALVQDGDSLLVDSGTTTLELVRALSGVRGVTIVTDDLTIADYVDRSLPGAEAILLGGSLRKGHRYTTGPLALAALEALRPGKAFVCPGACAPDGALMADFEAMAQLKAAFMGCAAQTVLLMDASKLGAGGLMRFGDVTQADVVVMDADPKGAVGERLEGTAVRLLLAEG